MSIYIIGDVQGCYDELQALLKKIEFDPSKDRLGFVGDLVNRGPKSLNTLQFIKNLDNPIVVLGNHDLHLLALHFLEDFSYKNVPHTLEEILNAPDRENLIEFLLKQPLLYGEDKFLAVHAGIPPQWSADQAFTYANEAHKKLLQNPVLFFENMYGNEPSCWDTELSGWDRTRYIVNAFTRMRFCSKRGELDLHNKTEFSEDPKMRPWFEWNTLNYEIYFGHWAALNGQCDHSNIFALDTGCAWGNRLTAIRVEDKKIFSVSHPPPGRGSG